MAYFSQKITKNAKATQNWAAHLAKKLPPGTVLALSGDLGGGKTTFIQGLASGLKIKDRLLSPTFVISKTYLIKKSGFHFLHHWDLYRLKPRQIDNALLAETLNDKHSLVAIEWAEKIKKAFPKQRTIFIHFDYLDEYRRRVKTKTSSLNLDKILKKVYN
jgi:tRNA threonylcarbamoyladenosine biosynthesis protein TsaE